MSAMTTEKKSTAPLAPDQQLQQLTRRSFAAGGLAALVGTAGLYWLKSARLDDGIPWPLRRVLQFNERISRASFDPSRLAPTFDVSRASDPRVTGQIGLRTALDAARWRLEVLSPGDRPVVAGSLPIGAVYNLPRFAMVRGFKCVGDWVPGGAWRV